MMQENDVSKPIEEYDLSILNELGPKEFNLQDTLKELLFYFLPIFSFLIFIVVLFSAIIPNINQVGSKLDEIDKMKTEDAKLTTRIQNIKNLDVNAAQNEKVITKIDEIVPTGETKVTDFANKIISSLSANRLKNSGIGSGEEVVVSSEASQDLTVTEAEDSLSMRKIPSKFDVQGKFEDVRNFFIQLYKGSDFFIVDKMALIRNDDLSWSGEVSLAKYQFSESLVFDPIKAYTSISENAVLNDLVMKFIENQFLNNSLEKVSN